VYKLPVLFLKVTLVDNPVELVFVIVNLQLQRTTYSSDSAVKIIIILIWIMYRC
jgi:hypothetical protein